MNFSALALCFTFFFFRLFCIFIVSFYSCISSILIGTLTGDMRWRMDSSLFHSRPASQNMRNRCPGDNTARSDGDYSIETEGFTSGYREADSANQ